MTTPDKAAVERAIAETLNYYDEEFPLEKCPDRENFLVSEDAGGITVGQLRSLRSSEQPSGGNVEAIHKLIMRHSDQLSMEEVRTLAHDIAAIAPSGDALVGEEDFTDRYRNNPEGWCCYIDPETKEECKNKMLWEISNEPFGPEDNATSCDLHIFHLLGDGKNIVRKII